MTPRKAGKCSRCGETTWGGLEHRCQPAFRVWCPEWGHTGADDARKVYALDAQSAAEQWAQRIDVEHADYTIVSSEDIPTVIVMRDQDHGSCDVNEETGLIRFGDRRVWRFEVTGESVPRYRARLVDQRGKL